MSTGNATLYVPEDGRARVYRLDQFVCRRDPSGNLLEWVSKEPIARAAIPEETRNKIPVNPTVQKPPASGGIQTAASDEMLDLFTHIVRKEDGQFDIYQEVGGQIITGSEGTYIPERFPFLVLRYNKVDGEDYGRGLIEEYLGDLCTLRPSRRPSGSSSPSRRGSSPS